MIHPGVQADVQPPRLQYFRAISTPSYNLSSILSIIPGAHFLDRLRKGASSFGPTATLNMAEIPTASVTEVWPTAEVVSTLAAEATGVPKVREYQQIPSIPSPWEFFTSGYIAGLLIMAILLHRMQNVVIPSPRRNRHANRSPLHQTTFWERLHAAIFPLDFSRTATRFAFHLPTVYFLSKMLIVWILLVFQTCEIQLVPTVDDNVGLIQGLVERLARWAMNKEMAHICWSTFCAVCGAFWIEGLIKTLDGLGGGGFPLGGVNSLSPLHLVSYAFLLYIYSSPAAHGFHPSDDSPSRPDKHIVITITIAFLQLFMFHILSISKRLSTHRLIPTTITSVLSLTHFHATLFFHPINAPNLRVTSPTALDLSTRNPYVRAGAPYPVFNYVPNLFETALLATILLTITVNAIAQLLVRGQIDHVLSGLGFFNGFPNDDGTHQGLFANLPYEDDFIVVLLRIGVASLEATGLRGWNNEVAPIQRPKIKPRRIWSSRNGLDFSHLREDTHGRVRMGRLGVAQVQYGSTSLDRTSVLPPQNEDKDNALRSGRNRVLRPQLFVSRLRRGFNNDVRIIDLGHANASGPFSGPWNRSIVAIWQFLVVLWAVIRGFVACLLDRARRRVSDSRRERKNRHAVSEERDDEDDAEWTNEDNMEVDADVYQRFLRGEDISDDDEEAMEGSSTLSDEDTSDETDEENQDRDAEMVNLFTDLLRNPGMQDSRTVSGHSRSSGEMALAHLLHGSAIAPRPLTRRVWNTLTQREHFASLNRTDSLGDQQAMELTLERSYSVVEQRDKEKGLQHICVVCMLESREIICWPCRCLAMCDGCRETLASRTLASKHRCPCCRQIVDGYSKIYIP